MDRNDSHTRRNILIAVDESENARRAIEYVARLLLGIQEEFRVALLHVIVEPDEDFFITPQEKEEWYARTSETVNRVLDEYRNYLIDAGFSPAKVTVHSPIRYCPSIAECILAEQEVMEFATIVVGRKGISRKEELLFGSVSSKLLKIAQNCAVWVIQ
jgi:nucleotide-binding universal stress UspA family protein